MFAFSSFVIATNRKKFRTLKLNIARRNKEYHQIRRSLQASLKNVVTHYLNLCQDKKDYYGS